MKTAEKEGRQMEQKSEWIERYLYDVVKRLPEEQRKDIEQELRSLIEDMLEERAENGKTTEQNIREVLEQLGRPADLAAKYRGTEPHLVGGRYYPVFCQVLRIVLLCVAAGMCASAAVNFFLNVGHADTLEHAFMYLGSDFLVSLAEIPGAMLQAFGMLTLLFFLLERKQVRLDNQGQNWSVESLQPVPYKKAAISRADSIAGIIFCVLVSVLFIYTPEIIGACLRTESGTVVNIPVFNMAVWEQVLPLFLLAFLIGLLEDLVKLISGYYSIAVMWITILAQAVNIAVTLFIFKGYEIWNPNFAADILEVTGKTFHAEYDIMAYWNRGTAGGEFTLSDLIILIVVLACLLDIGVTVYRTVRYAIRKEK